MPTSNNNIAKGKLLIFSAPSGSGKTTIVSRLLNQNEDIEFSISACTREKRSGEVDGKDYYFLSQSEFESKIKNNEFVEWEEVYPGAYYGTLKSEIERITDKGHHVIFDVDVVGGLNLKKHYEDRALSVFVKVSSKEDIIQRLEKRGTESPEVLARRIQKMEAELSYENYFDVVLLNDDIDTAVRNAQKLFENLKDGVLTI